MYFQAGVKGCVHNNKLRIAAFGCFYCFCIVCYRSVKIASLKKIVAQRFRLLCALIVMGISSAKKYQLATNHGTNANQIQDSWGYAVHANGIFTFVIHIY